MLCFNAEVGILIQIYPIVSEIVNTKHSRRKEEFQFTIADSQNFLTLRKRKGQTEEMLICTLKVINF